MAKPVHFQILLNALRALPDTGEEGFEGVLRDTVGAVVGRHLSLVKTGPQGGIDAGTPPEDGLPSVGIEAKRYGAKTHLGVDELKAKLVDVVGARPDLDLMIYGATKQIAENDQRQLIEAGDTHGVGVVCIDWPASATLLPPLAVLCASAPDALLARIEAAHKAGIQAEIEKIQAHTDFAMAAVHLAERLTRPDLGYAAARRSMAAWLRERLADRNAALASLGGVSSLLEPGATLIPRPKVNNALKEWMALPTIPLALLGDEGVGKSWAPLAWWHETAGTAGEKLPLTLVIPARDVRDTDADELVAQRLAECTGVRTLDFWRRRLGLWLRSPASEPIFLIVLDGVNENWDFLNWDRLLAGFAAEPWRGKVAIILSCRPDHWKARLKELPRLEHRVLRVSPFDDGELDEFLALHGKSRKEYPQDVLPLLRIPRLCQLAMRHAKVLGDSGDVTRERLVYEDWKDRVARQGAQVMGDDEFRELVASLGASIRDRMAREGNKELVLTRSELTEKLGADSGNGPNELSATISEIVDGRWMVAAGRPHQFRLNPELTPFALGLALVDQLKKLQEVGLAERLADFIDPLREQDLAVDLLRAAATIALADTECPDSVRIKLLGAWTRRQNFRDVDFEAFWRLIPTAPHLFLALAEEDWLHPEHSRHEDEVFIKAIANAADRWPAVGGQVVAWCTTWMGTHWGDPIEGMVINYDPNEADVPERCRQTAERRGTWDIIAPRLSPAIPIRDGVNGDVSWLACRVIGVLSYLPRSRAVPAVVAWAVSRAIMGEAPQLDQIAWLLRLRRDDNEGEMLAALMSEAERLLALNHPVATQAARNILWALATPGAASLAGGIPAPEGPRWTYPEPVKPNPVSGVLGWDHQAVLAKDQGKRLRALNSLHSYALDPRLHLDEPAITALSTVADGADTSSMRSSMGTTDADISLEWSEAALARWAPEALGRLLRRLFAQAASRKGEALYQLAWELPQHLLVLEEAEISAVATGRDTAYRAEGDRAATAIVLLNLANVIGRPAKEQIPALAHLVGGPNFNSDHSIIFSEPTQADFDTVARKLQPDAPVEELTGWLWYLSHAPLNNMPTAYPPVAALFNHPESIVRQRAFEVAYNSEDPGLAAALAESGWRWTPQTNRNEGIDGSLVLTNAATHMDRAQLRGRIDPGALGRLMLREGADEDDIDAFLAFLRTRIQGDMSRTSHTVFQTFFLLGDAVDRLADKRGDQLVELVEPFTKWGLRPRLGFSLDEFPYIDICRALLRHRPEIGAQLWQTMREELDYNVFRSDAFTLLPYEVPSSKPVLPLRDNVCEQAKNDEDLGKIAMAVIRHDAHDWILKRITADLNGPSAGAIARGLWLAGLLDNSEHAEKLWRDELANPPADGWLADVHERARANYRRNAWARHWLTRFLEDRDRDHAFAHHLLFTKCADRRVYAWAPKLVNEAWEGLPEAWKIHWQLAWPAVRKSIEATDKEWKDRLFGTKITTHVQWPWR